VTHSEFVAAYRERRIRIHIDPRAAAKYMSARLLLPLVMMPVLGIGVALALIGWVWAGLAVIAIGIIAPRLIKRSATRFIVTNALKDERFYLDVTGAQVMRVEESVRLS
jgi:hypothetical protein